LTFHEYHATNTTGFIMPDGVLANGTTYYWRICPQITPLTNWSATFHFNVDLSAGKTTVTATSYSAPATVAVPTNATNTTIEQTSPAYIWAIIIIGAILVIAIIVLILRVKK
jgi:trimeric autotransporter adhesin